ncbi:ly6/PLAUR domain-containing protein 2-like [Xenopus tropicalis]|uniref:Ly6/PLAUR domain-containing protein 2-like n=1 Tax=Xenopus tropicalis TaxID=8364 RepID=A0A8J1JT28_XENTR|nr:ly6/PLAUR domain-containing protein 2-like [Xenopus tropicalis]
MRRYSKDMVIHSTTTPSLTMAALYVSLLLAALCIGTAAPLQCYTCLGATGNCLIPTDCRSYGLYCQTILTSDLGFRGVVKFCTASCTPGSISTGTGTISTLCCNTDLCNGATGVKYSYPALGLSLGFLLVLLRGSAL